MKDEINEFNVNEQWKLIPNLKKYNNFPKSELTFELCFVDTEWFYLSSCKAIEQTENVLIWSDQCKPQTCETMRCKKMSFDFPRLP